MAVAVRAGAEMADTDSLRGALWVTEIMSLQTKVDNPLKLSFSTESYVFHIMTEKFDVLETFVSTQQNVIHMLGHK